MLFNLHIFVLFFFFFLWLIFSFVFLWSEEMLEIISILLNFEVCFVSQYGVYPGVHSMQAWKECVFCFLLDVLSLLLFSCQGMSDFSQPIGLQHSRPPCPSLSPGVCPSSCPLNWWCLTISSSVALFSFCLQFFPASGSFPMSWFFVSGGQSIGASASASVLPMNI